MSGSNVEERVTWKNKFDFVLALTTYNVGLGNFWRQVVLAPGTLCLYLKVTILALDNERTVRINARNSKRNRLRQSGDHILGQRLLRGHPGLDAALLVRLVSPKSAVEILSKQVELELLLGAAAADAHICFEYYGLELHRR
ncbi:unnamed protein product [Sphagnum balticum]